jgi:ABC-2 type transport system ATP-binding protein
VDALQQVDLSVEPGEVFGLLGRNGAGKTTLVKILLDMVRPTAGRTSLLGKSSRNPAARRAIGYLPEDHRFPDYQTGWSALMFHGALAGLDRHTRRRRAAELLETVDLTNARDRKIRTFSKGMKQRLGLAQALLHEPQILLLDEPTDGVDPVGRARIRDLLVRLRDDGTTIFLNSHLLSEVEQICDRVGILELGRLVRLGSIDELTEIELVYRVEVVPAPPPETLQALAEFAVSVETNDEGQLEVGLGSEPDVDRLVDALRGAGCSIRSLSGKRASLEEVFLRAIEGGEEDPA